MATRKHGRVTPTGEQFSALCVPAHKADYVVTRIMLPPPSPG